LLSKNSVSSQGASLASTAPRAAFLSGLRKWLFSISPDEATFARRGFQCADATLQRRLEGIGKTFLLGYHAALESRDVDELAYSLNPVEPELVGFAFEGAAMGLTLLDCLSPFKKTRFQSFLNGPASAHVYMAHVGAGWALARLPWQTGQAVEGFDSLLRWLALDGFGFHEGYFHWRRYVRDLALPKRLSGYATRAFDQGLGRSLWFIEGADVSRIPETIASFPLSRQADLWSGVGIACAYAGGAGRQSLQALRASSGRCKAQLAQGVVFAAEARRRANAPSTFTEIACEVICESSTSEAADLAIRALENLVPSGGEPAYEVWRRRIQLQFSNQGR
jgi:enediyne biosynthesis protein E3